MGKAAATPAKAADESADESSPVATEDKEEDKTDAKPKPAPKTPKVSKKVVETPTRVSARIAAKAVTDAFSDDEAEKVKLAPNPELPDARGKKKGWSFQWVMALVFMVLGPVILISLHTLCTKASCKPQVP